MDMSWYGVEVTCSCGKDTLLQAVQFSADGELLFLCYCNPCKSLVQYRVFASSLAVKAMQNDIEKTCKKCFKGIVRPPLAQIAPPTAPPAPPEHNREDEDFLHGLGIDPGE